MSRELAAGVSVRLPVPVRRWIGIQAARNLRSVNAEIRARLEAAMTAECRSEDGSSKTQADPD